MRFFSTKERRVERTEFVYKYRNEIEKFIEQTEGLKLSHELKTFIDGTARKQLGYSCRTIFKKLLPSNGSNTVNHEKKQKA
jgi:hypothetical protein